MEINNNNAANEPNNVAHPINEQVLTNELTRMNGRLKYLIPFAFLLLLKLFFDNFFACLLIATTSSSIYKIRSDLNLQISLKKRSSALSLIYLLLVSIGLLIYIFFVLHLFGNIDQYLLRLLIFYPIKFNESSIKIFDTFWQSLVLDGVIQIFTLSIKIISCLYLGSKSFVLNATNLKTICGSGNFMNKF
jgi:hypothetical protein